MALAALARKIFGSPSDRQVKRYQGKVAAINALEPELAKLSDEQLRARTQEFKAQLAQGASLDDLIVPAFATVREASKRVLGMRHFDVQLIGGMVLNDRAIAEMRTGEGKTLVATLAVYLNALTGNGVHVVTVNDYLARRDAGWMGQIYNFLGLSYGIIVHGLNDQERRDAYAADITYGTNNEFGFDYLRDNMKYARNQMVQRGHAYAIVDEVDSILIDEARTPLIISGPSEDRSELYIKVDSLMPIIGEDDFELDEKLRAATFTDQGVEKLEAAMTEAGLLKSGSMYDVENVMLVHHANSALRAHKLFRKDKDYIVRNDEVVIIDEFSGRMMPGRRYSEGLHQALEAKERVKIQAENQTLASITFQNYFRLYGKLAGMTGTADTEAYEFQEIYGLETMIIPPNRISKRDDQLDRVYKTTREKYEAAIQDIRECYERGQPVLVGTSSIENSEIIDGLLEKAGLPHQVLNAKQHAREADIVAQAGRTKMITIATNMAGRGTDIVLGGNIEKMIEAIEADEGRDEAAKKADIEHVRAEWTKDHEFVKSLGGLRIIATERHESRRIDNQLRGRSGRQGDPGSSRFYLSLDDPLMRIFAGDRVKAIMDRLKMPDGEAIEAGIVTRSIESAQRKVEARNFDIRKQLLEYDDVSNDQRKVIYQQRNDILDAGDLTAQIAGLREGCFTDLVRQYVPSESVEEQWDLAALENTLFTEWGIDMPLKKDVEAAEAIADEDIVEKVLQHANETFDAKVALIGQENFTQFERMVLLQSIDTHWREHLASLDYLRQGIHLRGYAQKQPKQEYKREAFELFGQLLDSVKNEVTRQLMTVRVQSGEQLEEAAEALESRGENVTNITYTAPTETGEVEVRVDEESQRRAAAAGAGALSAEALAFARVGRNDPCPCGSGKKYKQCHGKLT